MYIHDKCRLNFALHISLIFVFRNFRLARGVEKQLYCAVKNALFFFSPYHFGRDLFMYIYICVCACSAAQLVILHVHRFSRSDPYGQNVDDSVNKRFGLAALN